MSSWREESPGPPSVFEALSGPGSFVGDSCMDRFNRETRPSADLTVSWSSSKSCSSALKELRKVLSERTRGTVTDRTIATLERTMAKITFRRTFAGPKILPEHVQKHDTSFLPNDVRSTSLRTSVKGEVCMPKTDLDIWQLAAKVARMDAEIGQLWALVERVTGEKGRRKDPRQLELLDRQQGSCAGPRSTPARSQKS